MAELINSSMHADVFLGEKNVFLNGYSKGGWLNR